MIESTEQKGTFINWAAQKFVQVCAPELKARGLNTTDLMVLLAIVRHFPAGTKLGWVAISTLADETIGHRNTVLSAVKRLTKAGVVEKSGGKRSGSENVYKLLLTDNHYQQGLEHARKKATSTPDVLSSGGTSTADVHPPAQVVCTPSTPDVQLQHTRCAQGEMEEMGEQTRGQVASQPAYGSTPDREVQGPARLTSAQELADFWFDLLNSPSRHTQAAKTIWGDILQPLIAQYGIDVAKAGMTYAMETTFWPDRITKYNGGPAKYAVEKMGIWLSQRADDAERASYKKPEQPAQRKTYVMQPAYKPWPMGRKDQPIPEHLRKSANANTSLPHSRG